MSISEFFNSSISTRISIIRKTGDSTYIHALIGKYLNLSVNESKAKYKVNVTSGLHRLEISGDYSDIFELFTTLQRRGIVKEFESVTPNYLRLDLNALNKWV